MQNAVHGLDTARVCIEFGSSRVGSYLVIKLDLSTAMLGLARSARLHWLRVTQHNWKKKKMKFLKSSQLIKSKEYVLFSNLVY